MRRDQREYLNALCLVDGSHWRVVTSDDPDFDPGSATELPLDERHVVQISVFADRAAVVTPAPALLSPPSSTRGTAARPADRRRDG
jgi:hypothetical protein